MSVRVVARIRPLLKQESASDIIVHAAPAGADPHGAPTVVKIPNPKNDAEQFSFQFNSVYGADATQQQVFDCEVAPTVKHLFNGGDVTLFAYGVTGTGKTHTMRGGKSLADRGVIPRLLSGIFRRGRKVMSSGTHIEVRMSYYEIYNDRVYDLFEPPEKRTAAGLPIRDNGGKSVVVGLTERPCETLKDFETLYDAANINRSTSATKLNAHSSRSHAILCVKLHQTTGETTTVSTASAIDLAGSEDNRRTENNKDRMVESASINKSLFVLAQCVEAISRKQPRVPYRESKMTRILSLGQNNGLTVMILNLAPVRSYHLDTLSSLNFANRTKKIEVAAPPSPERKLLNRQPLRPLAVNAPVIVNPERKKLTKSFAVFTDNARDPPPSSRAAPRPFKRPSTMSSNANTSTSKSSEPTIAGMTKADIEAMIEARLARMAAPPAPAPLPVELQTRLAKLEARVAEKEDSEGLQHLLLARQAQARGDDVTALRLYTRARPFFPGNEKLLARIRGLEEKLRDVPGATPVRRKRRVSEASEWAPTPEVDERPVKRGKLTIHRDEAIEMGARPKVKMMIHRDGEGEGQTPRTASVLRIINSRDTGMIRGLHGVGAKRAEAIAEELWAQDEGEIRDLAALGRVKGVGARLVEKWREGVEEV
ncbi:kinesin-domain-containing protein [Trichodelitschia bisporula]|uniref:Kinesin-domain-containing protein n=1 Tax=Trichodelitschia bisporula TaxID=703511 RepID=A0A6G1I1G5_9PEZI|nr:kinesin-domain-containing protein [Trichodelitschia bisporula]